MARKKREFESATQAQGEVPVVAAQEVKKELARFDGTVETSRKVFAKPQSVLSGTSIAEQMELVLANAFVGMADRARDQNLSYNDLAILKLTAEHVMGDAKADVVSEGDTNYVTIMLDVKNAAEDAEVRKKVENLLIDKTKE